MPTNLAIDDNLIREAQEIGGPKSKKVAVTTALEEYVQRHKQAEIIKVMLKEFDEVEAVGIFERPTD